MLHKTWQGEWILILVLVVAVGGLLLVILMEMSSHLLWWLLLVIGDCDSGVAGGDAGKNGGDVTDVGENYGDGDVHVQWWWKIYKEENTVRQKKWGRVEITQGGLWSWHGVELNEWQHWLSGLCNCGKEAVHVQGVSEKSVFFEICILSLGNVSRSDFIPKSS